MTRRLWKRLFLATTERSIRPAIATSGQPDFCLFGTRYVNGLIAVCLHACPGLGKTVIAALIASGVLGWTLQQRYEMDIIR